MRTSRPLPPEPGQHKLTPAHAPRRRRTSLIAALVCSLALSAGWVTHQQTPPSPEAFTTPHVAPETVRAADQAVAGLSASDTATPAPPTSEPTPAAPTEQRIASGLTLQRPLPTLTLDPPAPTPTAAARSSVPNPAPTPTATPAVPEGAPLRFTVATFNVLGHSHTAPGGKRRKKFAPSTVRTPRAAQIIRASGASVVGLQEFQPAQVTQLARSAPEYATWPGRRAGGVNSVAWDTGVWQFASGRTVPIPYFGGRDVPMPAVQLRHRDTGRLVWFANFHNPADARGPAQRWRDEAVRRQVNLALALLEGGRSPVVFTGDFNDRAEFFCPFAAGTAFTSPDGSTAGGPGGCNVAPGAAIDWIVGSPSITWSGYTRRRDDLVSRTSDHPYIYATATM